MSFPSTFSSFSRPNPTDKLNSPSHSALHNTVSSALGQLEAVIGLTGASSVLGTIEGDLRSPSSGGGGHVQTAILGGTGQTMYTKGDILVAQGPSVLSKLAVGTDGQVLLANSSVATGVMWGTNTSPKVATFASLVSATQTTTETSIFSVSIPASTLGTSNALRVKMFVDSLSVGAVSDALTFRANYGSTSMATIIVSSLQSSYTVAGEVRIDVIANSALTSQRIYMETDLYRSVTPYNANSSFVGMKTYVSNPVAIDAGATANLGFTANWNASTAGTGLNIRGYTVERIT